MNEPNKTTRRGFLIALGRTAVAAGLAAVAVALGRRSLLSDSQPGPQQCAIAGGCRQCGVLADCPLPAALSFRKANGLLKKL